MKSISTYFITPPINTELTESDVSNQVSGANIQAHVVLEPEVSNEQTANEGFDANILQAPGDEHCLMMIYYVERDRDLQALMTSKL